MKLKWKYVFGLVLTTVLLITTGLSNIDAEGNNQAGTIRTKGEVVELIFYSFQDSSLDINDISRKNPNYVPLDRETIEFKTQYIAFDNGGYIIPFEDVTIDKEQLKIINSDIEKGIDLFKENGKTNLGDTIDYPLTLTTPEGRKTNVTVRLNIGGNTTAFSIKGLDLKGNDISYNVKDGALTWDKLIDLAEPIAYNQNGQVPLKVEGKPAETAEVVQRLLDDLNEQIEKKNTGDYVIEFLRPNGENTVGRFIVSLYSTYDVRYTDGVDDEEVFADQVYSNLAKDSSTPGFIGNPTREGYTFEGWLPKVSPTVVADADYVAQWQEVKDEEPITPIEPTEPTTPEKPGETEKPTLPATGVSESHLGSWTAALGGLLLISGVISDKKKRLNK